MKDKIQNPVVCKLVCRKCRVSIPTNQDVGKAIVTAVEHGVYNDHLPYNIAMTIYGTRGGVPLKHTIAI